MRVIQVIINENGNVGVDKFDSFEGENNATKLVFEIPESWKTLNKYLDAIYTNQSGVEQKIQFPPLNEVNGEIAFLVPQVLTFSAKVGFQFLIKNTAGDIIQNSDVFNLFFKKSILADPGSVPEMEDIINFLVTTVESLGRTLDNTIQDIFNKDLAINNKVNNYIESNDAALEAEALARQLADETLYEDVTQDIANAKQQVKDEIIGGAPEAFDTLLEIAAIFQNDPNLVATILNTLATKVDKVAGKGLSTNDFTNELKTAYDAAVNNSHTHANKAVLDLITDLVKQGYDTAASQTHTHTDLATLNALTAIWKLAVDDVVTRLAAKWLASDIALNQIGLTHLTAALQQLIGSNNNITNYPDTATIESYLDNSVNKLRIKDYGIDPTTKISWKWTNPFKGLNFDGIDDSIIVPNNASLNPEINGVLQGFSIEYVGDFSQNRTGTKWFLARGASGGGFGYSLYNSSTANSYYMSIVTSGGEETYQISTSLVPITTKSIIVTIDFINNKVIFYIDGINKQERAITKTGTINIAYALCLGAYKNNNSFSGGNSGWSKTPIYCYRQYNKTLTAAEALAMFNNGRPDLVILPYYLSGSIINELSSGTLIIGKMYKITARSTSDFTTVGAANNNINTEFIATATGSGLLDANNKVTRVGNVLELKGENMGDVTCIDSSGNNYHAFVFGSPAKFENPLLQKAWTGNFTTNIAAGTANKDVTIPAGYMIETITLRNTTAGNITNFQAILNPASWNQTLFSGKTIAAAATLEISQLADRYVDNVINMTLRFNCTGNGTGGIDIMVLLRRKD